MRGSCEEFWYNYTPKLQSQKGTKIMEVILDPQAMDLLRKEVNGTGGPIFTKKIAKAAYWHKVEI